MTQKRAMTLGQWKETSSIVITSILEFSSMCRNRKHSNSTAVFWRDQDHAHKSVCITTKNVLTTIGMSTCTEICQILGQDSRRSLSGWRHAKIQATTLEWFLYPWTLFECRQLWRIHTECWNQQVVRSGHESINQSQPCWALPHQAKGSNTEIKLSAHEQDGANLSTLTGT